ncbi:hypothetical protein J6590_067951 [Homalodisca vitripennis]|nr:hypothetical protein J6590_067951 [Homalodisca vitripennis]
MTNGAKTIRGIPIVLRQFTNHGKFGCGCDIVKKNASTPYCGERKEETWPVPAHSCVLVCCRPSFGLTPKPLRSYA